MKTLEVKMDFSSVDADLLESSDSPIRQWVDNIVVQAVIAGIEVCVTIDGEMVMYEPIRNRKKPN